MSAGRARACDRLLDLHRVRARHALLELRERAEEAGGDADVGHLDAHVAVEVGAVAVPPLAHLVGERAERDDVGLLHERERRRRTRAASPALTFARDLVEESKSWQWSCSCSRSMRCAPCAATLAPPRRKTSCRLDQRLDERRARTAAVLGRTAELRQLVALLGRRHRPGHLVGAEGQRQRRALDVERAVPARADGHGRAQAAPGRRRRAIAVDAGVAVRERRAHAGAARERRRRAHAATRRARRRRARTIASKLIPCSRGASCSVEAGQRRTTRSPAAASRRAVSTSSVSHSSTSSDSGSSGDKSCECRKLAGASTGESTSRAISASDAVVHSSRCVHRVLLLPPSAARA